MGGKDTFFFFSPEYFFLDFFVFFSLDYRISHVSIFFSNYCVINQYMFNNIINALRSDYCIMFRQYANTRNYLTGIFRN